MKYSSNIVLQCMKKSVFTAQHLIDRFNHRIFQSFFIQCLGRTIRSLFLKPGDTPPDYGSTASIVPMNPSVYFTAFTAINDTGQSIFTAVDTLFATEFQCRVSCFNCCHYGSVVNKISILLLVFSVTVIYLFHNLIGIRTYNYNHTSLFVSFFNIVVCIRYLF